MGDTLREELERDLAEPLHYASQEARNFILDSLACHLHNKGYFIKDVERKTTRTGSPRVCGRNFMTACRTSMNLIVRGQKIRNAG
jgi:hypothetical protein